MLYMRCRNVGVIFEIKQKPSAVLEIDRPKAYEQVAATNECCNHVKLALKVRSH